MLVFWSCVLLLDYVACLQSTDDGNDLDDEDVGDHDDDESEQNDRADEVGVGHGLKS